ncbi:hypothetical protein [Phenylobacterium sp.]|uniref:hypothetical protein n=1 Tax=Phenylobacterium sp. TaxID=1871053 RepID=UPI002C9C802A|nr:hypothetical protein [Phenylobacterium sp.]HVI33063.1 hypothetical protein [Phenylobacterium sp.]
MTSDGPNLTPPPPAPLPDRRELSRTVRADLEEIFQPVSPAPAGRSPRVRIFVGRSAEARERSPARWGALAAAAFVGLAAGALIVKPPDFRPSAPAASPPPAALTVASLAPTPTPAPPATRAIAWPEPPVATPAKAEPAPVKAAAPRTARPKPAKAVTRKGGSRCEGLRGDNRARCAYPSVIAADRRLRQAYASATRAGVPRATLVSYRNRWASLRHRADSDPGRVIAGYQDMAGDLRRLADRERRS